MVERPATVLDHHLYVTLFHEFMCCVLHFQIVFEGIKGTGVSGDIAIDDITYTYTSCNVLPSIAVPPTQPPTTPPPVINNCTFEQGLCSWTNAKGDNFDWTRDRGGTASWNTGPSVDHTLGTRQGRRGARGDC